jgi:hypothetical protein
LNDLPLISAKTIVRIIGYALISSGYPRQVFEHRWAQEVGGRDIIAKLAVDLLMARWWSSEEAARQWTTYPGW